MIGTSPAPQNANTRSSLNGGAIAGIVVGVLVALLTVGVGFFVLGRRWRRRKSGPGSLSQQPVPSNDKGASRAQNVKPSPTHQELNGGVEVAYGKNGVGAAELESRRSREELP
jgi:hypothetical protein